MNSNFTRHGGAYDRGKADSYYQRGREPHYYVGATSFSERVEEANMTAEEIAAYLQGFEDNEKMYNFKDYEQVNEMTGKVIRDGKVAVLVAPGYGAGWYSWNTSHPECLYDPDVVAWVENGKEGPVPDLEAKYGWDYFSNGGADDLVIEWVPKGALFRIDEYDGAEFLQLQEKEKWQVA